MFLVSSNPRKRAEFARFGLNLDVRAGLDLPEVASTPDTVALYKALAAGEGAVVEDTTLCVDGQVRVDIRWRLAELAQAGAVPLRWEVWLGHHEGATIALYQGAVEGTAVPPATDAPVEAGSFGFDPYFRPHGCAFTLAQLERRGQKDAWSARRRAVEALLGGSPVRRVAVVDIPLWTGAWQGH